jgi:hypothetical protein
VDAPCGEKEMMFGSIVIVFPTSHEGGALVLRHRGQEWTFDSSTALSAALPTSIAYAAFFCDVEHKVQPMTSGHHVTLTYNLYFDEDEHVSAKDLVTGFPSFPRSLKRTRRRSIRDSKLFSRIRNSSQMGVRSGSECATSTK